MKPFVKGDLEGFFALGLDNLLVFLLMTSLCLGILGFSPELYYGRILPAAAIGLIFGNLFYAREALKLAKRENRTDVCALPYGTSILTVVVFGFLVMLPAQQKALSMGMPKEQADLIAWHAGIVACIGSGLIEFTGAFFAHHIRRVTPRPALLVAIGGIGITFISMDFVFRTFAFPMIGFTTLALSFVFYFGGMRSRFGIPSGAIILGAGAAIAWTLHGLGLPSVVPNEALDTSNFGFKYPTLAIFEVWGDLHLLLDFLPIFLPMGFAFLLGSLQNIESAAAAGDSYKTKPSLMVNGIGTLTAAALGSPFPTSIYLGHPGYKKMGARAGYSTMNGTVWTVVALSGTMGVLTHYIPIEAGMTILIWIGLIMGAQAFQATESKYMPAVALGLVPAIAAYVSGMLKNTLVVAGELTHRNFFDDTLNQSFVSIRNVYSDGMFGLSQGYLFTCTLLTAAVICIIDRKFTHAAIWFLVGSFLSAAGFIHTYEIIPGDVIGRLVLPSLELNKWAIGYVIMAAIMLIVPLFSKPMQDDSLEEKDAPI